MKFNLFGIVLMFLAIGLGSMAGNALAGWIGLAGGIIGTIITGLAVYVIYAFLSGMPLKLVAGIIFAIMVWLANMIAGLVHGWTGLGGGIIGLGISAVIMSFVWGSFGAGIAGTGQTGAVGQSTSTKKSSKRRSKRS